MAQLPADCFPADEPLLRLVDAVAIVRRCAAVAGTEIVSLAAADGRVLAHDLVASRPLPPFDNAAVDGWAVRAAEIGPGSRRLPIAGRGAAGSPPPAVPPGAAARIFTGAPIPEGLDAVVMQEVAEAGSGSVLLPGGIKPGANVRRAGEDVAAGAEAIPAGRRIGPAEIALAAALGETALPVRTPLRVALASTGNEVAAGAGGTAAIHDANRPMLSALMRRLGCVVTDLGVLPDDLDRTRDALARSAPTHDLVLTSGGVSAGEEDHVRAAVTSLGSLSAWRVATKPGRPVAIGTVAGTAFLGLPGNPVAAFLIFATIGRPLLAALGGESYDPPPPLTVKAGFAHSKAAGRREFLRVRLENRDGIAVAVQHGRQGSAILSSLAGAHGFVDLPEDAGPVSPGDGVAFLPLADWF